MGKATCVVVDGSALILTECWASGRLGPVSSEKRHILGVEQERVPNSLGATQAAGASEGAPDNRRGPASGSHPLALRAMLWRCAPAAARPCPAFRVARLAPTVSGGRCSRPVAAVMASRPRRMSSCRLPSPAVACGGAPKGVGSGAPACWFRHSRFRSFVMTSLPQPTGTQFY